ncbi:hypothetical protein NC797_09065 [Aquibacillus sp. 3ASR75-11]|uniref:Uncharacterized protein n=1 Tax=Terrihalobacillus insolitus TaxID=2950438 RepID=A0A9X4AMB1_9BACI|nr:hypothetical protein [Terrihalobacillus insolitus]MDC3413584.1 hypothetical protein [Terrihalobacillus insolitus]MDC3424659.1 hypothetical protein [Terrihalobacillus insolitus]
MNTSNNRDTRRKVANLSILGTTQIHPRNPYIMALWSVAFPGFGHLLLSKYIRGLGLVIWELFINQASQLNLAMVYSFMGDIESAKEVLNVRLMSLYIPIYLFSIWDSYRTTVDLNKIYFLGEKEKPEIKVLTVKPLEINYLDKRNPLLAAFWAMTIPSVGQLYNHRVINGFFTLIYTVIFIYYSHFLEGIHYLFQGELEKSTAVINKQWLLYIPSFYFFTIYDSYMNTVENNKLFEAEQRNYLKQQYQPTHFKIKKGNKVR